MTKRIGFLLMALAFVFGCCGAALAAGPDLEQIGSITFQLEWEGEKLTVISQNIAPFLNLFRKKALESPVICTLSLQPGQEISVPQYKNLDQWSLEDLWIMIKGLGGLLGIKS